MALNEIIKENFVLYQSLLEYTNLNSTKYPSLAQKINYSYGNVFSTMNDGYTFDVATLVNQDYRIAKDHIVKVFQLINLPNFNYIQRDMAARVQLYNKRSQRDYSTIYEFVTDKDFYILNTM